MPELPEVETTRRGIAPHLLGQTIARVDVRNPSLRWPVPANLADLLTGQSVHAVRRRAKYLLIDTDLGTAIVHLGMSGSLRVETRDTLPRLHDHVVLDIANGARVLFNDPRRFGCWLWSTTPETHPLLARLGPEPFDAAFNGDSLYDASRSRKAPVKTFIMDGHVVVGVGNIYASEALFKAGIDPRRHANRISRERYHRLVAAIQTILDASIQRGGTTLRDFINTDGTPGYFKQSLAVYGRDQAPCVSCGTPISQVRIGQRSTFYCTSCQQ